jgi:hypothetical protein
MSISAITAEKQTCQVEIKWLHQCYVLNGKGDAFCVLEFIAEVKSGSLRYLDLYFPYKIDGPEDKTSKLLDENNKYFYTEGFKVVSIDPKNANCGKIVLDGLKTGVGEVSLKQTATNLGSKISINFSNAVSSGECRAVRIQFDCNKLSIKVSSVEHSLTLRYYEFNDAKFLKLDKAIPINHFFVWIVCPHGVKAITNITPSFIQQRTWNDVNLELMEAFYSSKTKAIWSKLPRTFGLWEKHIEHEEPALRAWTSLFLHCDYAVEKPELKGKPIITKGEYLVVDNKGKSIIKDNRKIIMLKKQKPDFEIFVDDDGIVYFKGKKVTELKDTQILYDFLLYFLENKGVGGTYENLFLEVWPEGRKQKFKPDFEISDSQKGNVIRMKNRLNDLLKKYGVNEITYEYGGYRFSEDIEFCFIKKGIS